MATSDIAEENKMFLSKLYIKKEFRGRGAARLMLENCVLRAKENELDEIYLTVNKNNLSSVAAYEKMGFVNSESVISDIGNGYYMDDYIMRLRLR